MKKGICSCLTLAVLAAMLWCAGPREAAAQTYYLQNEAPFPIRVALLLPSSQGWYSSHWFSVAPYSRKTVKKPWAYKGKFGVYAEGQHNNARWAGRTAGIVSSRGVDHPYNVNPGGSNARKVGFRIANGNSYRFTYSGGGGMAPPRNW